MSGLTSDDPRLLSQMISLAGDRPVHWLPEDLAAIWRHQLGAPLDIDLSQTAAGALATVSQLSMASTLPLKTFHDLLNHPSPPLELLRFTKEFAKARRAKPEEGFPPEVATALYYAAIALALARHGERLTELDEKALRHGLEWAMGLAWLDAQTRTVLRQTAAQLTAT